MPSSGAPRTARVAALDDAEEDLWRTLVRLLVVLPRRMDEDLVSRTGLTLTRYVVLMRLSEADEATLRMSDLADAASISPSRTTRVVQSLVAEGLLTRRSAPCDARTQLATLTPAGQASLERAWPAHLASVRGAVMDHLDPSDLEAFARVTGRLLRAVEATADTPAALADLADPADPADPACPPCSSTEGDTT